MEPPSATAESVLRSQVILQNIAERLQRTRADSELATSVLEELSKEISALDDASQEVVGVAKKDAEEELQFLLDALHPPAQGPAESRRSALRRTQSEFQAILAQLSMSSAATEDSLRGIEVWLASTAGIKNEDHRTLLGTLQKQCSGVSELSLGISEMRLDSHGSCGLGKDNLGAGPFALAVENPSGIAIYEDAPHLQSTESLLHATEISPQHGADNAIAAIWRILCAAQIGQLNGTGPEHVALCVVGEANSARHPHTKYDLYGDGWEVELSSVNCTGVRADLLLGQSSGQDGLMVSALKQHLHPNLRLDEIETADPKVLALFLRTLETGKLTDIRGQEVSFKNAFIILTTAIGSQALNRAYVSEGLLLDFSNTHKTKAGAVQTALKVELREIFRLYVPERECRGRIDRITQLQRMSRREAEALAALMACNIITHTGQQGIKMSVNQCFLALLVEANYDIIFSHGAWALWTAVRRIILDSLDKNRLVGKVQPGDCIIFGVNAAGEAVLSKGQEALELCLGT